MVYPPSSFLPVSAFVRISLLLAQATVLANLEGEHASRRLQGTTRSRSAYTYSLQCFIRPRAHPLGAHLRTHLGYNTTSRPRSAPALSLSSSCARALPQHELPSFPTSRNVYASRAPLTESVYPVLQVASTIQWQLFDLALFVQVLLLYSNRLIWSSDCSVRGW